MVRAIEWRGWAGFGGSELLVTGMCEKGADPRESGMQQGAVSWDWARGLVSLLQPTCFSGVDFTICLLT